jgi:hypothetical protein
MQCFAMIENYLNGCSAASKVVGVTLDQQYAYNWLHSESTPFVSRMVQVVPFYEISP